MCAPPGGRASRPNQTNNGLWRRRAPAAHFVTTFLHAPARTSRGAAHLARGAGRRGWRAGGPAVLSGRVQNSPKRRRRAPSDSPGGSGFNGRDESTRISAPKRPSLSLLPPLSLSLSISPQPPSPLWAPLSPWQPPPFFRLPATLGGPPGGEIRFARAIIRVPRRARRRKMSPSRPTNIRFALTSAPPQPPTAGTRQLMHSPRHQLTV